MKESKGKTIKIKIPAITFENRFWKILSLVLLVALVGSIYMNFRGVSFSGHLSSNDVGKKVIDFINNNLVQPGTSASLVSVKDMGSYYEIVTSYQGQQIPVYATKDGKILFLQAIDMTNPTNAKTDTNHNTTANARNTKER